MQRKPGGYDRVPQEEHPTLSADSGRARARLRYVGHRRPPPPKTTIAAVMMLVVGTVHFRVGCVGNDNGMGITVVRNRPQVMAVMGVWHMIQGDGSRGGPHLLIGGILLLPGSYASFNLLGAYLGWPGYDYSSIPSYDD